MPLADWPPLYYDMYIIRKWMECIGEFFNVNGKQNSSITYTEKVIYNPSEAI